MSHTITSRKFAAILAGLVLTATASVGHAQQKWMEQVLEQTIQEQIVAKEERAKEQAGEQGKATETADESLSPQDAAPADIDISDLYDGAGNSRI
ncbi:hypothetical protein [Marinobacter zhanjiangensis]|uniref:Uncharacterized protein n=1 Tax=Marinobacter zhanjiangensis TaxID=578215 RepID=A0ABQ3ALV5_9GAMM|nr:hypothetical protein [Marinobacter zhanjiangensis]GGY60345.1 hypothetical protein GCM10007071_03700 [Marinobacter zhanjiangensis]